MTSCGERTYTGSKLQDTHNAIVRKHIANRCRLIRARLVALQIAQGRRQAVCTTGLTSATVTLLPTRCLLLPAAVSAVSRCCRAALRSWEASVVDDDALAKSAAGRKQVSSHSSHWSTGGDFTLLAPARIEYTTCYVTYISCRSCRILYLQA